MFHLQTGAPGDLTAFSSSSSSSSLQRSTAGIIDKGHKTACWSPAGACEEVSVAPEGAEP